MPVVWAMGYLASRRRILPRIYLIFGKKGADVNVKNAIDLSERRGEVRGGGGPLVQQWCAGAACGDLRLGSPGVRARLTAPRLGDRELAILGKRVLQAPASVPQGWAMVPMRHEDTKGLVMHDNYLPLFAITMV